MSDENWIFNEGYQVDSLAKIIIFVGINEHDEQVFQVTMQALNDCFDCEDYMKQAVTHFEEHRKVINKAAIKAHARGESLLDADSLKQAICD